MSVVSDSPSSLIYKLSEDREQVLEFVTFYEILHSILPSWEEEGRDLPLRKRYYMPKLF